MMKKISLIVIMVVATLAGQQAAAQEERPKLVEGNIEDVINAMTLREKAMLLVGATGQGTDGGAMFGRTMKHVPGAAGITTEISDLGVTSVVMADGPAGVRIDPLRDGDEMTYYATGFPIGSALACTWNTDLVEQVGEAIGNEVREYGCDVILGPGVNIHRNPLCGRNFEYYSEDPIVTGKIAAAYIRGVQSQHVGTSIKHFAVNSQETDRIKVDERVSKRALREIYLRGFEIAIKESNPWTVMASYNKINGTLAQESRELLTDILRTDWGYDGLVMTDWIGLRNTAAQVHAGNDLMEPGNDGQVDDIVEKVQSGVLSMDDVDTCVRRVLQLVMKTPRYKGYKYSNKPDLNEHARVTRQSAAEGMVLLKNDNNTLPLEKVERVALFGVNSYDFFSGGTGSGYVNTPYVVDMVEGLKNAGISTTPKMTEIYQKYLDFIRVKFDADRDPIMWFLAMGQPKLPELELTRRSIYADVDTADAAIITIGRQAGEGMDRDIDTEFNLTDLEKRLIDNVSDAFHLAGKKVIVVINSGSVVETASWRDKVDAILMAWQPGEEGGNTVADILTGKVCPSGKTTMTWPISAYDHHSTNNYPQYAAQTLYDYKELTNFGAPLKGFDYTNHDEDIYVGYRYFKSVGKNVAYPFGYGLSYTTFEYERPTVRLVGDKVEVSVAVRNTGSVAGKEIVEVYVSAPETEIEKPVIELKAFAKTQTLEPGASEVLRMSIPVRDIALYDEENSQWLVEAGTYTVSIGASVDDIRAAAQVKLKEYTEKTLDVLGPQGELKTLRLRN